jgi:hypothetical protein
MSGERGGLDHRSEDWERSERISFRVALAIALMPIPAALLISWALGSPPWQPRSGHAEMNGAPPAAEPQGHPIGPGHRE